MKILICDDDINIRNEISKIFEAWAKGQKVSPEINSFESADLVIESKSEFCDIAFIDIEMPGINGLTLAESLKKANENVLIFVITSFQNYLDSAMKIKVFRYITKPIDHQRIIRNLNDAVCELQKTSKNIIVKNGSKTTIIQTKTILYILSEKHGCCIYTKTDAVHIPEKSAELLRRINQPDCFAYSETSCIVNLQNVIDFDKKTVTLRKDEDNTVRVFMSGRRYTTFKQAFLNFAGGIL